MHEEKPKAEGKDFQEEPPSFARVQLPRLLGKLPSRIEEICNASFPSQNQLQKVCHFLRRQAVKAGSVAIQYDFTEALKIEHQKEV